MAKIFLSHSTEDKPWLVGLVHKLKWLGHKVFIDEPRGVGLPLEQGIPIGERWYEVLERELRAVDKVLVVWSPAAAAKMKAGAGQAFSREIFWAAKNRKLVFAYIEQNASPTEASDAAFYASMVPIDTSSLSAMLSRDEVYGRDRVVAEELGAQHFRIEGLRLGEPQMVGKCDGIGRLQREVLAPERPAIEIPADFLNVARDAIDRSWQLGVVEDLIQQAQEVSPGFATFHVSSNCLPKTVLDRLENAQPKQIPWQTGADAQSRRKKLDERLNNVLSDPIREAKDGAAGSPLVVHTTIAVGKDGVRNWDHAKTMCREWDDAVSAIAIPPNLPVLFVAILEDKSALGQDADQFNFSNRPWVPFGRVPTPEMIGWAECDELRRLVESHGFASFRDRSGRRWTTQDWIHQRLETLFGASEVDPTMREAQREAEALIDQAAQMAMGAGAAPTAPDGSPIFPV